MYTSPRNGKEAQVAELTSGLRMWSGSSSVSGMEIRSMNTLTGSDKEADTTNGSRLEKSRIISSWIFGHPYLGRPEVGYIFLFLFLYDEC